MAQRKGAREASLEVIGSPRSRARPACGRCVYSKYYTLSFDSIRSYLLYGKILSGTANPIQSASSGSSFIGFTVTFFDTDDGDRFIYARHLENWSPCIRRNCSYVDGGYVGTCSFIRSRLFHAVISFFVGTCSFIRSRRMFRARRSRFEIMDLIPSAAAARPAT